MNLNKIQMTVFFLSFAGIVVSFRRYDKFLLRLCQLQPWFILFFKQNVFLNLEDNIRAMEPMQ